MGNANARAMIEAAEKGDVGTVKRCIAKHAKAGKRGTLDMPNKNGETALMAAAREGRSEVVAALIGAGADLNVLHTRFGITALMGAALHGHLEAVQALIGAGGAALDVEGKDGNTALSHAARNGHLEVVQELVRAGASLNAQRVGTSVVYGYKNGVRDETQRTERQSRGMTALMRAAQLGHTAIVEELVRAGAAPELTCHAQCGRELTALTWAKQNGRRDVIAILEAATATGGGAGGGAGGEEKPEEGTADQDRLASVLRNHHSFPQKFGGVKEAHWYGGGEATIKATYTVLFLCPMRGDVQGSAEKVAFVTNYSEVSATPPPKLTKAAKPAKAATSPATSGSGGGFDPFAAQPAAAVAVAAATSGSGGGFDPFAAQPSAAAAAAGGCDGQSGESLNPFADPRLT